MRIRSAPLRFLLFLASAAALASGCATTRREVAARDRFPLDPREEIAPPYPAGVERGWAALSAEDPAGAAKEFQKERSEGNHLAADIGWIEAAVLLGRFEPAIEQCHDALGAGDPTVPLLVACGEASGRGGKPAEGFRLYRQAVARRNDRSGLKARMEELRLSARDALAAQARVAGEEHRWAEARERIAEAILMAPEARALRVGAAEIEESAGEPEKALERYREAFDMDPSDVAVAEHVGNLALDLKEHALAVTVFDALARVNTRFGPKAEEARLAFRIANWPPQEREAARAPRLTRASAATLVWWMFPEVREARVSVSAIASDAVSRRDSRAFSRAVALGLLEVDRETHRGSPDATLTLGAGSRLLLRLLTVVRPGEGPPCLGKGDNGDKGDVPRTSGESIKAAEGCGLWTEGETGPPGGPAFTRALDRVRALAAGDAPESSDE